MALQSPQRDTEHSNGLSSPGASQGAELGNREPGLRWGLLWRAWKATEEPD